MHLTTLLVSISLFWLLLSGHYTGLLLSLGAVSCGLTAWICIRMGIVDRESHPHHIGRKMPMYWLALTKDTLISCWKTVLVILQPSKVTPVTQYVKTPIQCDLVKATLANSITLTPGTLTLDVLTDAMRVHALTDEMAKDLINDGIIERARKLEQ